MGVDQHMRMDYDLKVPVEKSNEWARMTETQREAYHHFYDEENKAFLEANLTGKDLVRWKYQRYLRDYLSCVDAIDSNVGRILDYLGKPNRKMCSLYLALMEKAGVRLKEFGDSKEALAEI